MSTLIVIPARYASTRFPAKPLAMLAGKPLLRWTWEAATRVGGNARVIVATDDARIADPARAWGAEVVMTSPDCPSGSDRCAAVLREVEAKDGAEKIRVVANVQGDEPFLEPQTVRSCIARLREDAEIGVATPVVALSDEESFRSPHVVKALPDAAGRAIYFSRAPIPADARSTPDERLAAWGRWLGRAGVASPQRVLGFKHVGLYVFRREALLKFTTLAPSRLEQLEKLEQLRLLENGVRLGLVPVARDSVGIDTPDDLARAERFLRSRAE